MNNSSNSYAGQFLSLAKSFGLKQHVMETTDTGEDILDLVLLISTEQLVIE